MRTSIKLFCVLCVSALFTGFAACSDDDDKQTGPAKEIAATYVGNIILGADTIAPTAEIKVEYVAENKVKLSLDEIISDLPIKVSTETQVTVDSNDKSKYLLQEAQVTIDLPIPGSPVAVPITITLEGYVQVAETKEATIDITVGLQGSPLAVVFKGTAK
jgi:hypothetical protein